MYFMLLEYYFDNKIPEEFWPIVNVYSIKKDGENNISYRKLAFNKDCDHDIFIYRNGIRQFESIDYSMDTENKTITIYTSTEQNERFVFEYLVAERK